MPTGREVSVKDPGDVSAQQLPGDSVRTIVSRIRSVFWRIYLDCGTIVNVLFCIVSLYYACNGLLTEEPCDVGRTSLEYRGAG